MEGGQGSLLLGKPPRLHTWLFLPRFWQVGDAGMRTQEHVAGVQRPLQEKLLGLREVDAPQRSLGQSVGGHQSQAVHAHLVNAVYGLQGGQVVAEAGGRLGPPEARTCRTRLIHWKLSSSLESGRCSATTTIRSSWSTGMENTAILQHTAVARQTRGQLPVPAPFACSDVLVPAPVDELHGLDGERRGHDVIGAVPTPSDGHQAIHFPHHKDEPGRSDEAQQARPGEGELADGRAAAGNRKHLQEHQSA